MFKVIFLSCDGECVVEAKVEGKRTTCLFHWRIKDQLDVTCYFFFHFLCAQHDSDINTSIIRSLRLFCSITTLIVLFLVRCVLEFRCGWVGVVSVLQASTCNTDTTPTHPCWAHKKWNKIASDIKLVLFFNYHNDARSNKHKIHDIIVLLRRTERTRNKQEEINHSYKLLTAFRVVPDDVCGSFAGMGKATNTISVSWSVNFATSRRTNVRVSSLFADCLQCNGCFSLESDHSSMD